MTTAQNLFLEKFESGKAAWIKKYGNRPTQEIENEKDIADFARVKKYLSEHPYDPPWFGE